VETSMSPQNNLLVRLHKWASRQDENFVTEAFAHLIQHLIEEEPQAASGLLRSITNGFLGSNIAETRSVTVRTQIITGEGTPDLALFALDKLVYLEIKVESEATERQLRRYRELLSNSSYSETRLILLTRHVVSIESPEADYSHIRWHQIADWLENERLQYTFKTVSGFLVEQFLGLLGIKGMTMSQVTWELSGGIRALRNFLNMLEESAHVAGCKVQVRGNTRWSGVMLDGGNYSIAIYFDDPDRLIFETYKRRVRVDAAKELGIGYVFETDDKQGHGWAYELDLTSEGVHFYARPRSSQMQVLELFIRESMELVKKIELPPDQNGPDGERVEEDR